MGVGALQPELFKGELYIRYIICMIYSLHIVNNKEVRAGFLSQSGEAHMWRKEKTGINPIVLD